MREREESRGWLLEIRGAFPRAPASSPEGDEGVRRQSARGKEAAGVGEQGQGLEAALEAAEVRGLLLGGLAEEEAVGEVEGAEGLRGGDVLRAVGKGKRDGEKRKVRC